MALDPRYITSLDLQQDFLDKQTGLQLAGGTVWFFSDINRNNLKPVYELTGSPPNYTFSVLPNPITLSNVGTFTNGAGDDISVYYFPYAADGSPDNYFIEVFAAGDLPPPLGTPILTREAVPGITTSSGPQQIGPSSTENEISNSQFATVFFNPDVGISIPYTVGQTSFEFAPGWFLQVQASGSGTVALNRISIAGTSNFATQPPYALMVNPSGVGITSLIVLQRLQGNPNIFASANTTPPSDSFISAGIALAPGTGVVDIYYAPQGNIQPTTISPEILEASNPSGVWKYFTHTAQLNQGPNVNSGPNSFTDIQIKLPSSGATTFSSVQIVGLAENIQNIPYNEQPVIQQINQTFFSRNNLLSYKPIPSYLIGWDFPLNPAQINGDNVAVFAGANSGGYFWDQTVVFQTTTNSVSGTRAANGGLTLTCVVAGQVALIQYLDQVTARKILSDRASVHLSLSRTIVGASLTGNVSLWATTDANLPTLPTTFITAMGADGIPTAVGNGFVQVPNIYNNRSFTVPAASATNNETNDISLNGWDLAGAVPVNTATYFAIVVGFSAWAGGDTLTFNSIGLCPGDIATRPAPKTQSQTLLDCQRYFYSTFPAGVKPVTNYGVDTGCLSWSLVSTTRGMHHWMRYPTTMRKNPTIIIYNPAAVNNNIRDTSGAPGDLASSAAGTNATAKTLDITCPNGSLAGSSVADILQAHVTSDARLGVVN